MLVRSKLNSIERVISKALLDNEIGHEDFTTIIQEERNYCELKERIRMMKSQRSVIERNRLIENGIIIGIDQFLNKIFNEIIK